MFVAHLVLLLGLGAGAGASVPLQTRLVPSRREVTIEQRSLWNHDIAPKGDIVLNYAQGKKFVDFTLAWY